MSTSAPETVSTVVPYHSLSNFLKRYVHPWRVQILLALAAMLLQSLLLVPLPWLQGHVIDSLTTSSGAVFADGVSSHLITVAVLLPLMCLIGRMGLNWFSSLQMNRISLEVVRTLTDDLHGKLQRLPLAFFDRRETGDLMARLTNDVGTLLIFLNAGSLQTVADLMLGVGVVFVLLSLSWPLASMSLLVWPLFLWNPRRHAARIQQLSLESQQQTADLYSIASERLSAMRVIRAFGTERHELNEFRDRVDRQLQFARQNLNCTSHLNLTALLIGGLSTAGLVCLAAIFVQQGLLTTGSAVAFVAYLGLLYQPLIRLTQSYGGIAATWAAVSRMTDLLEEPETRSLSAEKPSRRYRGELRIENVSFRYEPESPLVLKDITLSIPAGSTVGICGESGSGKSTLLSLLPRLYELPADSGRIRIDGSDIRDQHPEDLRRNVLLVSQHARLFEGTLRYNLSYAARQTDEALISRALAAVEIKDFVEALPQKLDTWTGEGGCSLSGGQRQRLALARGLLAQPSVLLLDDCASALDAQTEARVQRQLTEFDPHQTKIIVSHKPELLKAVDWLVVLHAGHLHFQGRPDDYFSPVLLTFGMPAA